MPRGTLQDYYRALLRRFGPQRWWPGDSPFEVMVGAVLTQNTSWTNTARAIARLKDEGLLDPHRLHALPAANLARLIRPAGYFRLKARRLKNLVAWLVERYDGDVAALDGRPTDELRRELLDVNGVGPETADSILLYALGRPVFVIDQYTYRVLSRHAWVPEETTYEAMKELFESRLSPDAARWNEYHALLVRVGHAFCRPQPKCEECPLKKYLPA
jgi:endonuclease-3 related protein